MELRDAAGRWHFAGRWYALTMASDIGERDGMGLELEDVAPAPGRGIVLEVFFHDRSGDMTFTAATTNPLPMQLVEQFLSVARQRLPPIHLSDGDE